MAETCVKGACLAMLLATAAPATAADRPGTRPETLAADIVVYGCTSAGVIAAIEARRLGRSVLLVCRDDYLGGMTTNGLGWSDTGNHRAIGGLSRDFYRKVKRHYDDPAAWNWAERPEQAENFVDDGAMWQFEPKVAERIYEDWVREAGVTVVRNQMLDRSGTGVAKQGNRVVAFCSKGDSGSRAPSSSTPPTKAT